MSVYRAPPLPFVGGSQPLTAKRNLTLGATNNQVVSPGVGALVITGYSPTVTQSGGTVVNPAVGSITITGYAPTVLRTGLGSITLPPMKNNTGSVLASETGVTVNVYNPTTGVLIVQKTGQTSDGSGVIVITDALIVGGTSYTVEPVLLANGRRLPVIAAV